MKRWRFVIMAAIMGTGLACGIAGAEVKLPDPALDAPPAQKQGQDSIVVAGGCFWGVQAVFQHVKGVVSATSGYAGGDAQTAHYDMVGSGRTGHAESVRVVYDPSQVTLGQLLKVFFSVAHDPTQLDRQGPDSGTQYRSAIFAASPEQQRITAAYIAQLDAARVFSAPIATRIEPLKAFYAAEDYHQDYARTHPTNPYILINDAPKVAALERTFPDLYVKK